MLTVGDKIKLKKSMGAFTNIGEICDVVNITEDTSVCFRFGNGMHLGCMSYNELETYFDKVEQTKYVWTNWEKIKNDIYGDFEFKTNGRKVIVKKFGFKAESTCHPTDTFDRQMGLRIALKRINVKKANAELDEILKSV